MPNQPFEALEEGEPRGEKHDEPREDGLSLVERDGEAYWVNEDDVRVCGARRVGFDLEEGKIKRCRMPESRLGVGNRCKRHGGASKTGAENPAFKDGRHSKYLPKELIERYQKFLEDPELTSLREELALLDTRLSLLLSKVDEGYGLNIWMELQDLYGDLVRAVQSKNGPKSRQLLKKVGQLIQEGIEESKQWEEVSDIVEQRRKVAHTEHKRVQQASKSLSVEEAMMMVRFLTETVLDVIEKYNVPDKARDEIADAVERIHLN